MDPTTVALYEELCDLRTRLVEGNLRLVASVARKYDWGMDFLDCMRAGVSGLIRALDGFEPSRGTQLSTYATWWIMSAITRDIANHRNPVRVPVHFKDRIPPVIRALRQAWEPRIGSKDLLDQVASELRLSAAEIVTVLSVAEYTWPSGRRCTGLVVGASTEEALWDITADPLAAVSASYAARRAAIFVARIMAEYAAKPTSTGHQAGLRDRNLEIARRRLGIGQASYDTLEQIGQDHSVSRERIRQIESKVFTVFRAKYGDELEALLKLAERGDIG